MVGPLLIYAGRCAHGPCRPRCSRGARRAALPWRELRILIGAHVPNFDLAPYALDIALIPAAMVAATQTAHDEETSPPPRKRVRVDSATKPVSKEPRLFAPFRALGLITNHVPFVLQARSYKGAASGPTLHLVTCLGKAWAMWEGGKMTLQFVGT